MDVLSIEDIEFEGAGRGGGGGGGRAGGGKRVTQQSRIDAMTPRSATQVRQLPRGQRTAYHTARNSGLGHRAAIGQAKGVKPKRIIKKKAVPAKKKAVVRKSIPAAPKRIKRLGLTSTGNLRLTNR